MRSRLTPFLLVIAATLSWAASVDVQADPNQDRRAEMGARLFRSVLLADLDIEKKLSAKGEVRVVVIAEDAGRSRLLAETIARRDPQGIPEPVRKYPIVIEEMRPDAFLKSDAPCVAVFIAQPLARAAETTLKDKAEKEGFIVFSPFEGDVERGFLIGLSIEAQVRFFVNTKAAGAARIRFKELFLKAAKVVK